MLVLVRVAAHRSCSTRSRSLQPFGAPQLGGALAHQLILSRDDAIALLCITVCVIALIGMACASARRLLASVTVVLVISVGALVFGGPFIGIAPSSTNHNMYSMTDDSSNIINGSSVSSDMTPGKTIASGVLDLTHAPATISSKDVYGSTTALDVIPNNLGAFAPGEKCGMANNWTHSIDCNISCVCIPLFDSAAATARTRRDYLHLGVDELQRKCLHRAIGPPICAAAAGSVAERSGHAAAPRRPCAVAAATPSPRACTGA